ncbi:peptidyl-prolyl cis-trans isomerase [Qipengyuania sp. 1XM1-15A]|uniref:peptidylprolyl isomerase n=1 Tax=Qipengyuania xiamenensis TaxID=2867237 RepID=UPI001C87CDE9|nr:peptidylprolyl isomerase [Qipengyuania xiamenensis]MBX7532603.1 peptidyl-prolyl cis-trans isomerase [Qipengyuania xiamenensis]
MIRRLLRDPLAHFLIAGAAIWGLLARGGDPVDPAERTITLSREQQAGLALGFERTMGRPPTDAELDAQIDRWTREEVLYREALRLGLDQGDPVVRRRLAAKMDELAGAEVELAQPSEAELREWLAENPGAFETGGLLTFEQVYFSSESGALAARDGEEPVGQTISLPRAVEGMEERDVAQVFGMQFAEEVGRLTAGSQWQGPIRSGYGWHLVRLNRRGEGSVPPFAEISERVEAEWRSRTIQARREKAYEVLRDAYRIEVE